MAARGWAAHLLAHFGSLARVLRADVAEVAAHCGGHVGPAQHIRAARAAMVQALEAEILDQPVIATSEALRDYLFATQAHDRSESLCVLLLDSGNRLIREMRLPHGTPNAAPLHPREIVRLCLETGATAVILAHNHPSGDPAPSAADIAVTRRFASLAGELGIVLHDHVIVARTGIVSLRREGHL